MKEVPMETINVSDAKTHLLNLVKRANIGGESFTISVHGKPAARLLPATSESTELGRVVERMLARREEDRVTLGEGLSIRRLIEEGRE
jgi:prevent-host-death family protein